MNRLILAALIMLAISPLALSQETCSMTYDSTRSKYMFEFGLAQTSGSPGRPGKRGAAGPPGAKGDKGSNGLPGSKGDPLAQAEEYDRKFQSLENLVYLTTGWKKASNGNLYMVSPTRMTWQAAKEFCNDKHGSLATIGMRDRESFNWILNHIVSVNLVWIGLNDIGTEEQWVWNDEVLATSSNTFWHRTEPNNINNEDCAIARKSDVTVHDNKCALPHKALCELTL